MADEPRAIERYTPAERTNHWLVALSFILVALSGLALFHPALFWLTSLFGGGQWTRVLHPFLGLFLFVAFVYLAKRMWADNKLEARDREWLKQWREVVGNREQNVPEQGRYNGGQKLLFWVLVWCMALLLVTGLMFWRAYFSDLFPVGLVRIAAVVHAIAAFVMVCTIIVHIYAAIWVKGSVQAMTRGTVSPGWAWKHHRGWFRQVAKR